MTEINAAITAVNGWVPDYVLTNKELEDMVDTSNDWIVSRTGMEERRILKDKDKASAYMGAKAIEGLLEKAKITPEEIDLIICATVTPDMHFPATANIISDMVGAKNAFSFDMAAACSGFIFALNVASKYIESDSCKKVIVVGVEKMSSIVDYTDRSTCILFGDAAGAVLLEPDETGHGIIDSLLKVDGSGKDYLQMKAGGSLKPPSYETIDAKEHFIYQEGQTVFKFAVTQMSSVAAEVMKRNKLGSDDVAWLVPHQANKRILTVTADRLGIPYERVMINLNKYGNTTAATIPLCLWEWESKLNRGDNLILTAFGGGFTWGAIYLKWAY